MAIGAVVDGLRGLAYLLDKYLDKKVRPGAKERSARREQEMFKLRYETEFEPLLCDGRDLKPSIADLPPERRTVHLRFLDLKAKVCRPFAK